VGLSENEVFDQIVGELAALSAVQPNARSILDYACTEILNNAIDHSRSPSIEVDFVAADDPIWFEVVDRGVGIFEHIRATFGLESREHAIEQLTKGKLTTDPDHHTGEGIFFVSKIVDYFEIDSGGLRWMVDNRRSDQAIATTAERVGTRVRCEISPRKEKTLESLFNEFTEDFKFTKTHQVVKLLERGVRFVSRSEAKRLCAGLERFSTVTLDFRGVEGVGQGFADEVFRVWTNSNPNTLLIATSMNPAVEFMVRRAGYLPPTSSA
jgi:anti-sigma regulatory factor (Ser/Thr protein kinase)